VLSPCRTLGAAGGAVNRGWSGHLAVARAHWERRLSSRLVAVAARSRVGGVWAGRRAPAAPAWANGSERPLFIVALDRFLPQWLEREPENPFVAAFAPLGEAAREALLLINTSKQPALQTSTLRITPQRLSLVAEIDELKGAWRALGTLAPERLSALRRVATIESVGASTRIEGSRLSDREVARLLANLEIKAFASRDEQEVAGYADVMETVFASWSEITVTENHIKQLHHDLLRYSDKDQRHRGEYKTASNSVAAFDADGKQVGVVFETASPFETPRLMTELVAWLDQAQQGELHPLIAIGIFVVSFLVPLRLRPGTSRSRGFSAPPARTTAWYSHLPRQPDESSVRFAAASARRVRRSARMAI
jgi:hypothetical protein